MSSASGMCQTYPVYTSGAPEDVSTALHGSGEGSLCTKVRAARGTPCRSFALINPFRAAGDLNARAPRARDRPAAPQGAPVVAR